MAKRTKRRARGNSPGRSAPSVGNGTSVRGAELFAAALQHHQSGKLSQAEPLYQQVLALKPDFTEAHNNLGNLLMAKGQPDEAATAYQRAIALKPDFAQAHYNLALALSGLGRLDEAAASCARGIALKPDFAEAHNNLGNLLRAQGRLDEAAESCRRAIALKPEFVQAHYSLALALSSLGRLDEAVASYQCAIALKPDFAEAHYSLALAFSGLGRLDDAAAACRRSIALKPDLAEAHFSLGNVLRVQDEAEACYRRAIALKPDLAEAHNNLGNSLLRQGRIVEAAVCLRRAAELETGRAEIWFSLGRVLEILGELEPARAAMLRAAELDPRAEEAIHSIAGLQPMHDGSPEAEAAFAVVGRMADNLDQLAPDKRPPAMFAMGKALEDRGEYDRAFAFLAQANAVVRAGAPFEIAEVEGRMDTIAKAFNGGLLERLNYEGLASDRPIFIVGMARSGTTLVEQIISAHPEVHGAGEIANLSNAIAAHSGHGRSTLGARGVTLTESACRAIAQSYLDSLPLGSLHQSRVTDKYLSNFEYLGLIHLCLPNATIIHCRRDPRDVCLSCYASRFRPGQHAYAYDLVELGRYWRAYDRLMAHWRTVLPPGRMLEVPYEAVVEDVEVWARRLIAHCGLGWDDDCLRFYESKREVFTASLAQVRRPIYISSVGRWRPFARHLGPLLETLGEPWGA